MKRVGISHTAGQIWYARRYATALFSISSHKLEFHFISPEAPRDTLKGLDGIIFTGGKAASDARNILEISLLNQGLGKIPTLGICRGMQLANHVWGGGFKDASGHDICEGQEENPERRSHPAHLVRALNLPIYRQLFGVVCQFGVNSRHAKVIDGLGRGMTAIAESEDGEIEAIIGPKFIGVQWHPEDMMNKEHAQSLFFAFSKML